MRKYRERKKVRKLKNIITLSLSVNIVFIIMVMMLIVNSNSKDKTMCLLSSQLETSKNEKLSSTGSYDKYIIDLEYTIKQLDSQLKEVKLINESYVDELTELRNRSELYDKYQYAIIDETGNRTALKYEEIKLGEQLMLEKGYDPDLMFGTIMVESRGNPDVVNEESGATGYGQFLDSTAEFVWTNLMGNTDYSPEVMKNGENNIRMMAEYYDYLYKNKGDTFSVVKQYSGNSTDEGTYIYLAKVNSFTNKVGEVVE